MRSSPLHGLLLTAGALALFAPPPAAAQMGTSRPSFSAPAAASLGRFGEVPVSLHTGQPDISIPLFTAAGRTLQLPVSLRYQSGGIRLDDVGSWVGMGWALEAGGVITRSVRGLPDDSPYGYWNTGHVFYDDAVWPRPSSVSVGTHPVFLNIQQGYVDGEPDQFFFNFAGRAGQFVIGPTGASSTQKEVRTIPHQKLRIEPQASFTRWVVTAEDGTRYTFAAVDTTMDLGGTSSGTGGFVNVRRPDYISSWHLTEIRAPAGDVIRLHYTRYTVRHFLTDGAGRFNMVNQVNDCSQASDFVSRNGQQFKTHRLDSITSAAHTIRFIPDATLRADALDDAGNRQEPRLAQIEVRTPTGTVVRRFVFDHDYFGGNRLRLKNVFEQNAAGNALPPWTFEYDPQSFPARGSFAQDHGGYWNGKSSNYMLVPAAIGQFSLLDGNYQVSYPGADRSPDGAFARVGVLTRLTYPTGGSSAFTWEPHDYGTTRQGVTQYDADGAEQTASASNNTYMPTRTTTTTFTVGGTQPAGVGIEVAHACSMGMTTCASARLVGPGVDRTFTTYTVTSLTLSPGTYTLTATSPVSTQFSTVTITARWRDRVRVAGRKPGSGLRIAQVRTTDGNGGQQVRRYRYRTQADTAVSSGTMEYEPVYLEHVSSDDGANICEYFARSATSVLPLGASSTIGYREVTVVHGENGEHGRTREVFRNSWDNPDGPPVAPRPNLRMTATDWRRGQRLGATEYNAAGQVQQHAASRYTFRTDDPSIRRFRGISMSRFTGFPQGDPGSAPGYDFAFSAFEVLSEWVHQSADTVYSYDEAGNASVWTARGYTYGNPQHLQLTQLDESSSDGQRRITRMRYPADYAADVLTDDPDAMTEGEAYAHALTMMKGPAHIHSPVVERWVSEVAGGTERVLQAELTGFQAWLATDGWTYLPAMRYALAAPGPVTDFTPATVAGGLLGWDQRYQLYEQINGYDAWGRMREVVDGNGGVYTYAYGGNAANAFLTRITRNTTLTTVVPLVTELGYDASGQLSSVRDEGGALRTFEYDSFGRLRQVRNSAGTTVQAFGYTYSRTPENGWTYQPHIPNAVTDTTWLQQTPSVLRGVSTRYLDGLGRPVQTVVEDGASYHVTAREYDAMGRSWRQWKPYTRATAGYDPGFAASATSFYNSELGVSSARPYVDSLFTADALSRPRSIIPEYVGTSPTAVQGFAYGIDAATGRRYTESTDEAGKKSRSYLDGFGNVVRTTLGFGTAEAATTNIAYNAVGQRTQATDPRGIVTTYAVNTRGQLATRTNPDAGNRGHRYDRAGNLRYSQDATQAAAGRVLFTTHDFAGRPVVTGEGAASFAALDPLEFTPPALESTTGNWLVVRQYDAKPSTSAFPWSLFATQIAALTLNNVHGRLAAVASVSNGAWQAELYSYDADGAVAARWTYSTWGGSVVASLSTSIGYTRNLQDQITQRSLTVGSSSFYQWYDYDGRGLISRIYGSTSPTRPATPDAAYTYRASGGVQQRQYQGGPVVPLRYTIRDQVERIGDPASTAYPFSARYSYHPNGRLQEAEFYSAGSPAPEKRYGYVFGAQSWDALNRLRSADYSGWTGAGWTTTAAHDLTGISYDAAGNLTALGRYQQAGAVVDNLAYGYGTTNNRLGSVTDYNGATTETWDAETGSFTYDANGNVKTAPAPYNITATTYDHRNLPLTVTASGATTYYHYNADGQRYARRPAAGGADVYIREGSATLGVVTVNGALAPTAWHFNLLADDQVIGRHTDTGIRRYYHRDVLGSTRAVVEGGVVVESYDYDPWGLLMPGRTLAGPTRERFTGKEQDPETGLHYFGARYYMAALGRWTSVDPPADSFPDLSPYNYVKGNPVGYTDPDGLCPPADTNDGPWCRSPGYHTLRFLGVSDKTASFIAQIGYGGAVVAGGPGSGLAVRGAAGRVAAASTRSPQGQWTVVNEAMPARAAAYQSQVTGRAGQAFVRNGVKFDGVAGQTLIEAKGPGYANFVRNGRFQPWYRGAQALVDQAERQVVAAQGTAVRWHFAEESAANATRTLFRDAGITGIEIVVTPVR
jgi:RHS repeat-associated protein